MLEEFRRRKLVRENLEHKWQKNKSRQHDWDPNADSLKLLNEDDFRMMILFRDTTTLVTTLNRVNHFRALVFMGNCNGVIGYGKGRGNDNEQALNNAIKLCKRNLIAIPIDHLNTWTEEVKTSFYGCGFEVIPTESMNAWGHHVMAHMLFLAGVHHCKFKLLFRNLNPYAMVYAFFKAMTLNRTPKTIAERSGVKIYQTSFERTVNTAHPKFLRVQGCIVFIAVFRYMRLFSVR
eukprot:TRINITY_DN956_c0_g1_i9.p1 TRINITY_DN956_c0_g1~~TRINITY_DN956_c0_g1_i9.p1  ORF type:complete len:234 (-),score=36.47 TRINITY_DN956_c0_g1_i9:234-935(-)